MNNIFKERKNEGRNQTKTRVWEDLSLYPETSNKNVVQEFRLWIRLHVRTQKSTWKGRVGTYLLSNLRRHSTVETSVKPWALSSSQVRCTCSMQGEKEHSRPPDF